jgi:tripartite-type tricarboxylate transporter receptor subunit TctC
MYPLMANNLFGTKFKVVMGYENNEISTAMERGEVQGRGANTYKTYYALTPQWMRDGKIHFVFQMNMERDPALPDVPTLLEYAKTDEQRQIIALLATTEGLGRAIMAPPGVPADRVALLRKALMDVAADPKFLEEAEKAMLEINPIPGEKLQAMVAALVSTPPDIIEKYKQAVSRRN